MGLSEAILCVDVPFTGLSSHKETHTAGSHFNNVQWTLVEKKRRENRRRMVEKCHCLQIALCLRGLQS